MFRGFLLSTNKLMKVLKFDANALELNKEVKLSSKQIELLEKYKKRMAINAFNMYNIARRYIHY